MSPEALITILGMAAVTLGTMLAPLNSTMVAVALPEIRSEFDVGVVVNAPVTDDFFLRGVAYFEDSSGLVENISRFLALANR